MTIKFVTKGNQSILQIYVRLRDRANKINTLSTSGVDVIFKTGLNVLAEDFVKGGIIFIKIPKGADAKLKKQIAKHNAELLNTETALTEIKRNLLTAYNNKRDYEIINSKWLDEVINPKSKAKKEIPNTLVLYFDYYLNAKKGDLKNSTLQKIKVVRNRINNFETDTKATTYIQEIDNEFKQRFKDWSDKKEYHKNTFIKTIKVIGTICKHAQEKHEIDIHRQTALITKGNDMKYEKSLHTYLSFADLDKIQKADLKQTQHQITRDWLLISCNTAQRISDFMRFSIDDIVVMDKERFLDIDQEKTGTPVLVFLNDVVINILKKYNWNFPPLYSRTSKQSNENKYNVLVKEVCKLSKIDNIITAQLKNPKTNRVEVKTLPKYKFVSSHIGRRSYATNYFNDIDSSLLRSATGHKSEKQFLLYVSKAPKQNAKALALAMRKLSKRNNTPMKVIKNVSNQ